MKKRVKKSGEREILYNVYKFMKSKSNSQFVVDVP